MEKCLSLLVKWHSTSLVVLPLWQVIRFFKSNTRLFKPFAPASLPCSLSVACLFIISLSRMISICCTRMGALVMKVQTDF